MLEVDQLPPTPNYTDKLLTLIMDVYNVMSDLSQRSIITNYVVTFDLRNLDKHRASIVVERVNTTFMYE